MSHEPIRLADLTDGASSEEEFMRALIRTERTDAPTDDEMQQLASRLGPVMNRQGTFASSSARRWLIAAGIAVGLLVGIALVRQDIDSPPRPAAVASALPLGGAGPAASVAELGTTTATPTTPPPSPPLVSVDSLPSVASRPLARPASAGSPLGCAGEIQLLDRADAALRSGDVNGALSLAREHSERCPAGAFVQERERIAIDALARLGRDDEMRARARAFEARFPTSPHVHRIRRLVDQHSHAPHAR